MKRKSIKFYRTRGDGTRVGWIGSAVEGPEGWRFFPAVIGRSPSRKAWPSWEACLPRWVGYPDRCESEHTEMAMMNRRNPMIMTEAKLQKLGRKMLDCCRLTLEQDGGMVPMWHLFTSNGSVVLATPWSGHKEKRLAIAAIREVIAESQAEAWLFATEACQRALGPQVVLVHGGTRTDGACVSLIAEILRDPAGGVTLLEQPTPEGLTTRSRMFDDLFKAKGEP